jgi:hypothetical protein
MTMRMMRLVLVLVDAADAVGWGSPDEKNPVKYDDDDDDAPSSRYHRCGSDWLRYDLKRARRSRRMTTTTTTTTRRILGRTTKKKNDNTNHTMHDTTTTPFSFFGVSSLHVCLLV